jgi:cytochrome bd-type quinol oxidase subunit 2
MAFRTSIMRSSLKRVTIALLLSIGLAVPLFNAPASADLFSGAKGEACAAVDASDSAGKCDQNKLDQGQTSLSKTLITLLNLLTIVVGLLSVIMIVISGIRFVSSNGDPNHVTSARNTFIYALIGLVVVAFAQIIVKLVLGRLS